MVRSTVLSTFRCILVVIACSGSGLSQTQAGNTLQSPEVVLETYLRALYARDSDVAYGLLSDLDKAEVSIDHYRDKNGNFTESVLLLSSELARSITLDVIDIEIDGDWAVATLSATIPNANDPSLSEIVAGFDPRRLANLSASELEQRRARLQRLAKYKQLPVIKSTGERWDLVRENGQWRVFENWANSIKVEFMSIVLGELGWSFEPVRSHVLAEPGQTIAMAYRAVNNGSTTSTGKARHIIGPEMNAEHFEIVSCFCFLEQTLKPGEAIEMPLVFRVDYEVPESVRSFNILYEFYPLDDSPEDGSA